MKSSSPCLQSIKIYGSCQVEKTIVTNQQTHPEEGISINKKTIKVPDEFIDDLTHEMMRLPIRLPGGQLIDKTTLDNYSKFEYKTKSCEPLRDPFTRVAFKNDYKPIIDAQLKSKIDKFILDYHEYNLVFDDTTPINRNNKRSHDSLSTPITTIGTVKRSKLNSQSTFLKTPGSREINCECCLNLKSSTKLIYEIVQCKHQFCKHCLVTMKNVCCICEKTFSNNQIINVDGINIVNQTTIN
jgi:hypothetical protein